jgi:hypothetical protein
MERVKHINPVHDDRHQRGRRIGVLGKVRHQRLALLPDELSL